VVATIFTAGAALSVLAPGMSLFAGGLSVLAGTSSLGIAGSMAVAAGAAAVGSAASQLAGKAMGVVDHFSWSQVGISALTAAATAGVGGALAPAAGAAGTTGATATQSSWASAAKTAINNGGWVAKGAVYGAASYGSTYLANQVFGNNQSFSWAALGSSIVGSIAAAGIGAKGVFERLGTTASPYAYSLAGANAAAVIDDKWFGGAKPDYLNVSMAAIANTVGRQFGENAEEWFNYPTTKTLSIYDENAFSFLSTDYNSQQPMYGDASRYNGSLPDTVGLETIAISASDRKDLYLDIAKEAPKDNSLNITNALDGAKSFFQNRAQALEEWGSASVPFQYSWATPKINTGNPRLDRYYFQPVNDLFNTTANIGWNALKLAGNTAAIVSNLPAAGFSIISGDYEASQQFYEDLYLSNPLTASIGGVRSGLGYIRDVREFNKANVVGRTIGTSQRGSASLGLLNDIPAGSTTGEVLTASMPAPPIKALYPSTETTRIKAPFVNTASRTLHFDNIDTFNRAANNPIPNTSYKYGGITWTTDSQARVSMIEGEVSLKNHGRYVTSGEPNATVLGYEGALEDVGFHYIGNQFNGPINRLNVIPGSGRSVIRSDGTLLKNLNQSRYKTDFENPIAEIYKQTGKNVPVKIESIYKRGNSTSRPDSFVTMFQKPNGEWERIKFENRAGG
ncbi:DNA/RNA non-specific endonuclease, partial [Acinetobacter baumannii]